MDETVYSPLTVKSHFKTKVIPYNGPIEEAEGTDSFVLQVYRRRQGGSMPNWRQKIANGENATTNFIGDIQTVDYQPMQATGFGFSGAGTQFTRWYGDIDGLPSGASDAPYPGSYSTSGASNQALESLVNDIRNTQRSFQGGTFLGELADTIRTIKHPVQLFREGLDLYKGAAKERARRVKNRLKNRAVQKTWLEYQYGWLPLLSDARSAYKTLLERSKFFKKGEFIPVGGRGEEEPFYDMFGPVPFDYGYHRWWYNRITNVKTSVRYTGAVRGRPQSPVLSSIDAWGFNPITEFVPTVWELIPYSFLVDYFTNVGTIINSWSLCSSNIAWLCASTKKHATTVTQVVKYDGFTGGTYGREGKLVQPGSVVAERKLVTRSVPELDDLVPTLSFKLPGSGTKWLNIGALASMRRL